MTGFENPPLRGGAPQVLAMQKLTKSYEMLTRAYERRARS